MEMDGAALLKIACERFPGVVRIVVCSQEEMNGALRAVPVAHQFLLKPCEPHMLRVAVERATSLSDVLSNKLLANIVGSVKDLPVLPRTFMALREKLADPNASVKEVVKLVEQDFSISAKILQLVNSAFFGLPREISTLNTAVSYLGIRHVALRFIFARHSKDRAGLQHLAKDVLQNAAMLVVGDFERSVDARDGGEVFLFA